MRKLLFILLLTSSFGIKAQNYKGVVQGDTTYYVSRGDIFTKDSNLLRAIWITSSQNMATDSVFQFYPSIKQFYPVVSICLDTLGPTWLGKSFIRKNNDDEIYFNYRNDSIIIKSMSPLNTTWKITTDTNNIEIWGTVSQLGTKIIDNQLDSIKTITIQAYSNGLPVLHDHNGKEIIISKNHGFVEVFEFYIFPYTDQLYTYILPKDTSIHRRLDRSITEIDLNYINFSNMFQPGTYWQIQDTASYSTGILIENHYIQDSILSMSGLSPTSIIVNFSRINKTYIQTFVPPTITNPVGSYEDTNYTTFSFYTDTFYNNKPVVTIRNSPLPEHYPSMYKCDTTSACLNGYGVFLHQLTDSIILLNYKTDNMQYRVATDPNNPNCIKQDPGLSGNIYTRSGFIRQANFRDMYYYFFSGWGSSDDYIDTYMYFYKDSNQTWGTPLNLKTLSVNDIAKTSISVYPNPNQSGNFYIHTNEKIHWEVTDIQGVKIANGNAPSINLSNNNAGIYLLKIEINGQIYYSKLLKQ